MNTIVYQEKTKGNYFIGGVAQNIHFISSNRILFFNQRNSDESH